LRRIRGTQRSLVGFSRHAIRQGTHECRILWDCEPIMNEDESLAILLVDDEQSVRRTFEEWLETANLGCRVYSAVDAESALAMANRITIDLAILDWNLGAGHDGLRLLEDLHVFQPEVVAILVTGYAHQATPLAAMRMGVRDYLDKNQELDREVFLRA